MMEQRFHPERLRPPEFVSEPDPRNTMFAMVDQSTGTSRAMNLADHHGAISPYSLHAGVPEDVFVQFEVAKNLFLYSWFVYRFYPVAEHQSLTCLELALRKRLKKEIKTGKIKGRRPTLFPLIQFAVDHNLIRNEGFSAWQNRGEINSRNRVRAEKMRELIVKNLDKIAWDESEIKVTEEDLDWDYVKALPGFLRESRNEYAHGSTELYVVTSLDTIRIVSEIINQLYDLPA